MNNKSLVVYSLLFLASIFVLFGVFTCSTKKEFLQEEQTAGTKKKTRKFAKKGRKKKQTESAGQLLNTEDAVSSAKDAESMITALSKKQPKPAQKKTVSSYFSGYSDFTPARMLSDAEIKAEKEREAALQKKLEKAREDYFTKMLKDPSVSDRDKEKLRLRSNENYVKGIASIRSGEYVQSLASMNEAMKDPNASPVSKYFILSSMMESASKLGERDLYFKIMAIQAELISKEDLAIIGVKKTDRAKFRVAYDRQTLIALSDPLVKEELINVKLSQFGNRISYEQAKIYVTEDMAFNKEKYKELL